MTSRNVLFWTGTARMSQNIFLFAITVPGNEGADFHGKRNAPAASQVAAYTMISLEAVELLSCGQ